MKLLLTTLLIYSFSIGCVEQHEVPKAMGKSQKDSNYTYLALGDSYTIGESVSQLQSFPFQLQKLLIGQRVNVSSPKVIAKTGWTTKELQTAIERANITHTYSFVTLLIGVNNQYRGNSIADYRTEFAELLQMAIKLADGKRDRVFVISIPDWGVTPYGKNSGKDIKTIADEIEAFNFASKAITLANGVDYTDITSASKNATTDLSLVASDGLHPSRQMYTGWALALMPKMIRQLK